MIGNVSELTIHGCDFHFMTEPTNPLQMAFVASFKNPLEIECVLPPVFDFTGGGDSKYNVLLI